MDQYENDQLRPEQEYQPQTEPQQQPWQDPRPASQPYSGAGVGRKESPFADSPYEMNRRPNPSAYNFGSTYVPPIPPQQPPVKPKKERKEGGKAWKTVLCAVLVAALVAGSCGVTAALVNNRWEKRTDEIIAKVEVQTVQIDELRQQIAAAQAVANGNSVSGTMAVGEGLTPGQVYAKNVASVVLITCEVQSSSFGQSFTGSSSGSGFILTENGYVVTNAHVVDGASSITVTTHAGEELKAKLMGSDATNDVAVLKVEAEGLPAVSVGSSTDLIVGDQVVAIGNPLGELTSTLTVGYISAKDRTINTDGTYNINMMQTDAAINSGNSGGPLFNMKGEVIGITTAKYSGSSNSGASIEGIGFAIPMDDVMGILQDLRDYGYVKGAYLGVSVVTMDPAVAEAYGLPTGSKVSLVEPKYCAAKAGVQVGDIIIAMAGQDVSGNSDLLSILRQFRPGDTTTITVFRGGREIELSITLDEKPAPAAEQTVPKTEPDTTAPSGYGEMPQEGDAWDWFNYYFGFGGR